LPRRGRASSKVGYRHERRKTIPALSDVLASDAKHIRIEVPVDADRTAASPLNTPRHPEWHQVQRQRIDGPWRITSLNGAGRLAERRKVTAAPRSLAMPVRRQCICSPQNYGTRCLCGRYSLKACSGWRWMRTPDIDYMEANRVELYQWPSQVWRKSMDGRCGHGRRSGRRRCCSGDRSAAPGSRLGIERDRDDAGHR
jgi:hypothetical protein